MAKDIKKKNTPMMEQYYQIKANYPDALLFYRMGDFYEMFVEDALIAAPYLEVALTARGKTPDGEKIPMCGVPYHAADAYISKLINAGFKVAICEQIEDPKLAKGIVKRDVIRVITPGTVIDDNLIKTKYANYIACVYKSPQGYALSYCDISTGEFKVSLVIGDNAIGRLGDELARLTPAELLLPKSLIGESFFNLHIWDLQTQINLTPVPDEGFVKRNATELLITHFKKPNLEALGLDIDTGTAVVAAYLLHFIMTTQKRDLTYINNLQIYSMDKYMLLDAGTRRNLELTANMRRGDKKGSLIGVCDKTKTSLGSRKLMDWFMQPLLDTNLINMRLDGIEALINDLPLLTNLSDTLKGVYDLERIICRISYGNATPKDFIALKESLLLLPDIEKMLPNLKASIFYALYDSFDNLEDIADLIAKSITDNPRAILKDGGVIRDGFNSDVDELRKLANNGKSVLLEIEARERELTGIKTLKIGYNKVFGYYIEVSRSYTNEVPASYIRKQTLTNGERYITEELKEWETKILGASDKLINLEQLLFNQIREAIKVHTQRIQHVATAIATLDALQSLATLVAENNFVKPVVNNSSNIIINDGRHPVVEEFIGRENYVENDTVLTSEAQFSLITGPNMSGKSTYMRQVALIVLMARVGSYVPASSAEIGFVDRIFTRVGASDDLAAGQSTFMVEMSETSNILQNATKDSLIILDEIGRGTSTYDGLSLAWAISEYILQKLQAKTLFATHYHELIALEDTYDTVKNYSVAVIEKGRNIAFLHKIISGGTDKSYGIHVARLAGIPASVLNRADNILFDITKNTNPAVNIKGEQLAFIEELTFEDHPIIEEMRHIDINNLTPMEALMYLQKWQKDITN